MSIVYISMFSIFFFNDTATTEIYTLSLHDALPISSGGSYQEFSCRLRDDCMCLHTARSEEHTSELQSQFHLVCRLLLEKKKNTLTRAPRCTRNTSSISRSRPHSPPFSSPRLTSDYR